MSDNIPPYEIQLEIIKKAPDVVSLLRFRAVSKSWKSFIDSSDFITSYTARDTQQHRLLLKYNVRQYRSLVDDELHDFAPNLPLLVKQLGHSEVIGSSSSYGLWCLHGFKPWPLTTEVVVIWNPSIRKSIGIVVPCELDNTDGRITYFGFGVCPSTHDPTIVGISRCVHGKYFDHKITWRVGIFTLSSKTWKMIPSSNMIRGSILGLFTTRVAVGRFIFWVVCDFASSCKTLILSFDLITHEFKEVNLPDHIANMNVSVSKLRESLVVSTTEDVNERVYGVWMMGEEEGGATASFTKLFTINTPDSIVREVLGYNKSGEPIIETENEKEQQRLRSATRMKVYDPCSQQITDLGITGEYGSFFICPYTETLLLTDYSDCCIIPTIIEEENDGSGANDSLQRGFVDLGLMEPN